MLILLRVCFNYACIFSLGDGGGNELVHAPHWLEATTRALAMVLFFREPCFFRDWFCVNTSPPWD